MANPRIVYRFGSATDDALTPRAKDTEAPAGQTPGLSVEVVGPTAGHKAQKISFGNGRRIAAPGIGMLSLRRSQTRSSNET
jgi:hypothetical protein